MKSDKLMRIRKRKDVTFITAYASGEEILDAVIEETLASKPWLQPDDETYEERRDRILAERYRRRNERRRVEEKSICPVPGCGRRKRTAYATCYLHKAATCPSSESVAYQPPKETENGCST